MKRAPYHGQTWIVATHNPGKLQEWRAQLAQTGAVLRSSAELGLAAPDETEDSYIANARLKAQHAFKHAGLPAWADDTGLAVDALNGLPGVRTADFAAANGGWESASRVLFERARASGRGLRARLVCAVAYCGPTGIDHAEATLEGQLRWPPHDAPGFARMLDCVEPLWTVNRVMSHRAAAITEVLHKRASLLSI